MVVVSRQKPNVPTMLNRMKSALNPQLLANPAMILSRPIVMRCKTLDDAMGFALAGGLVSCKVFGHQILCSRYLAGKVQFSASNLETLRSL